jgi:hypothetical protein
MFYNKLHGSCSGTSEFYANVFQALGIPTKVMIQRTLTTFTKTDIINKSDYYSKSLNLLETGIKNGNS